LWHKYQRSHGDDLATHLMNALDNEEVEIAEVFGAVAEDLHGPFAEFEAIAVNGGVKRGPRNRGGGD
jgi:hypothetical protein